MITMATPIEPYASLLDLTSTGRVSLAWAMTEFCMLHWGADECDVVPALRGEDGGSGAAGAIRGAAGTLGRTFAAGGARTFARPFGGGPSVPLDPEAWELDDWTGRFLSCALNARRPWDAMAEPTHWIFVDAKDWARLAQASCGDVVLPASAGSVPVAPLREDAPPTSTDPMRLLRLPEVRRLTGLSRSSIYARMGKGTFPRTVDMGGAMAAWREGAVADWLRDPT